MTPRTVSLAHARRLALHAQGLAGARPPPAAGGPAAVAAVTQRIGCLQLDPVSAVARSPLLVLFARLGPLRDAALERAAYEQRALFDAWAHEASLVATADLPLHRWAMRTWLASPTTRAERARDVPAGERRLRRRARRGAARARTAAGARARGPLGRAVASRLVDRRGLRAPDARAAAGPAVDHRPRRRRAADRRRARVGRLRALPARGRRGGRGGGRLDDAAAEREAALRAMRMLGVARAGHVRAHFLRRRYRRLPATLAELVAAGRLETVTVAGLRGEWLAAPEDLERLPQLAAGRAHDRAVAVRQPALRPRADRRAVRLRPSPRDLRPAGAAALGLLRAADPASRAARRARRPRARPQRRPAARARAPPRGRAAPHAGARTGDRAGARAPGGVARGERRAGPAAGP